MCDLSEHVASCGYQKAMTICSSVQSEHLKVLKFIFGFNPQLVERIEISGGAFIWFF